VSHLQEGDSVKEFELTEPPFQTEMQVPVPSSLRLVCNATLSETADADKRSVQFEDSFEVTPFGRLRSASKAVQVVHTFVTQALPHPSSNCGYLIVHDKD
jgi:hypothetical protein